MTLKADFDIGDVEDYIESQLQGNIQAVINTYKYAGESFVRNARLKTASEGGFNDVTGNLRSSIGYIIIQDGVQLITDFEASSSGTDKSTGLQNGLNFAKEIATLYPKGITLICVAGMEYAAAVESKGKDVITGSSLAVEGQLQKLLQQI